MSAPDAPARPTDALSNMGLVHACAQRLRGRGVDYEDLVQNGCVGLLKAAAAFDPTRGAQFSTYAVPVILGEMRRLFRDGQAVRVGRSCQELARRVGREAERFQNEQGRSPNVSELSQALGVAEERVVEAVSATRQPLSLTLDEDDQLDLPVDSHEETVTDRLGLRQAIARLPAEDRRLLALRYEKNMTQSDAGACLGMTQVQVSRREKKILTVLRAELAT